MEAKDPPGYCQPDDTSTSFYIQATESIQERWPRTLKQGDTFALFDALGDVIEPGATPGGIFHNDTRHLSGVQLLIDGQRPLLLSSAVENDNVVLTVDLSNPDIYQDGKIVLPRETLHVRRSKFLWDGTCHERIAIHNFDTRAAEMLADHQFRRRFRRPVRDPRHAAGQARRHHQRRIGDAKTVPSAIRAWTGSSGAPKSVSIRTPGRLSDSQALFALRPEAGRADVAGDDGALRRRQTPQPVTFSEPYRAARRARPARRQPGRQRHQLSNALANRMLHRAGADLSMLITETAAGALSLCRHALVLHAVRPRRHHHRAGDAVDRSRRWRKGVLQFLAATQATKMDAAADAEPGKILHETRACEMANLGEVPFGRYYGSIDSTPLFVLLAARYFDRTGDQETIRALWPNIEAALAWIDKYGDRDGDGFVEYYRESENGLTNQGWKDSQDSIFHADGRLATGRHRAVRSAGLCLCRQAGRGDAGAHAGRSCTGRCAGRRRGKAARQRFEADFWCEEIGTYAIALDGDKKPCRVRTSNAGQVLVCGIASAERAARRGRNPDDAGNVLRLGRAHRGRDAPRFNPMSYHNGSVWPHDNALIALGLARYGLKRARRRHLRRACSTPPAIWS